MTAASSSALTMSVSSFSMSTKVRHLFPREAEPLVDSQWETIAPIAPCYVRGALQAWDGVDRSSPSPLLCYDSLYYAMIAFIMLWQPLLCYDSLDIHIPHVSFHKLLGTVPSILVQRRLHLKSWGFNVFPSVRDERIHQQWPFQLVTERQWPYLFHGLSSSALFH